MIPSLRIHRRASSSPPAGSRSKTSAAATECSSGCDRSVSCPSARSCGWEGSACSSRQFRRPRRGPGGAIPWGSPDPGYRFRLIQLLEGGLRGAAFPLKEGDNALGREVGDITFPNDGFVSGRHALLTVRDTRLVIRDFGSSNGTFVRLA